MAVSGNFVEEFLGFCHHGFFEKYEDLGVRWNRSDFPVWRVLDPEHEPFPIWDAALLKAKANGVQTLMLLDVNYTPEWASISGKKGWAARSQAQLEQAVEAVVTRYTQPPFDIKFFEISNEPNLGEFWHGDGERQRYETYIDLLLAPVADIVHRYGGKVVAPSITMEWPGYTGSRAVGQQVSNLGWAEKMLEDWLGYHDAWKYIDLFSFHYIKGDSEKLELPAGTNMMPILDRLYENWVQPGKIEGFWNTEEGLTAVQGGQLGFLSLKPWERSPYGQWAVRYTIPFLHWAVRRGVADCHQYKLFWFRIKGGDVLSPTSVVDEKDPDHLLPMGKAIRVMTYLFRGAETVGVFEGHVEIGFGLGQENNRPFKCTNYAFQIDNRLLIVAWMDLPGLETEGPDMEAYVNVEGGTAPWQKAERIDHESGQVQQLVLDRKENKIHVHIPRKPEPVVYLLLT